MKILPGKIPPTTGSRRSQKMEPPDVEAANRRILLS
jgi:hypothetical protein